MNAARIEPRLRELSKEGSLPKSACSTELISFVAPLLDSGVLVWERSGAGKRLHAANPDALSAFILDQFPFTELEMAAELTRRIASVGRFRNSKGLRGDTPEIVTVRGWADTALWCDGSPVALSEATRVHGVFSFALTADSGSRYEIRAPCAVVENPAVLLGFERFRLTSEIPLAIFGSGRVSNRLLDWLAGQASADFRVIHFPDYDPVGLSEFTRLHARLGGRSALHFPANLPESFARFRNEKLLRPASMKALLSNLRSVSIPDIRDVMDLIEQHNGGLEQEALLLE